MNFDIPKVRQFRPPRPPGRIIVRVIVLAVAAVFLFTTWFTVEPEEAQTTSAGIPTSNGPSARTPYAWTRAPTPHRPTSAGS